MIWILSFRHSFHSIVCIFAYLHILRKWFWRTYSLYGCPLQCLLYELSDFILSTGGELDGRMNIGSTLPQCLDCVSICFYLNELRTDYWVFRIMDLWSIKKDSRTQLVNNRRQGGRWKRTCWLKHIKSIANNHQPGQLTSITGYGMWIWIITFYYV